MRQKVFPLFRELFKRYAGIDASQAETDANGWLLVPPQAKLGGKKDQNLAVFQVLGWKPRLIGGKTKGWWVKPWPNIKAKSFAMLTLSEDGAKAFMCLKDGQVGQRHAYYIHEIRTGAITAAPMLLGQFLFEFEKDPEQALPLAGGSTNRIYFPRDKRIVAYDSPTTSESEEIRTRLSELSSLESGRWRDLVEPLYSAA